MNFFKTTLFLAGVALLSGCNGNPGWDGHKSEAKADLLAQDACKCIYEVMDADVDFDMDNIISTMDDYKKHQSSGASGSISEKFPDIATAMMKMLELTSKIDGSPCMGEVDEKALGQGVPIEDVLDALDAHCSLAVFYN